MECRDGNVVAPHFDMLDTDACFKQHLFLRQAPRQTQFPQPVGYVYEFRQKKCTAGVHFFAENLARGSSPCFKRRAQTRRHASWGNNIKIL